MTMMSRFKCAWYHYKNKTMKKERAYTILAAAFCVCLIASNIFETVIFEAGPLTLTGGFLVFPIIYIINDCLSEVYGYSKARLVILLAFALNLVFVLLAQLVAILPESGMSACFSELPESGMSACFSELPESGMSACFSELPESGMSSHFSEAGTSPQQHFAAVFRFDLRITIASMAAFLVGSLVNARVMVALKQRVAFRLRSSVGTSDCPCDTQDVPSSSLRGFGVRAIMSTLAGESLDSLVFFPIAFHGVGFKSILVLMVTQIVLKTLYEIILLPLTTKVVKRLKQSD